MVVLTQSMRVWLAEFHPELIVPIIFGHTELFTDELCREYVAWCQTEEGRRYLKGGDLYEEDPKGD